MTLKVIALPPPPKSHYKLKSHAFGALFEQAEIDYLESHSQTNS
jgi:hypothetical protein